MIALSSQAVDAGPDHKMRLGFPGCAEQLVDVALAIADMDASARIGQQLRGLPDVVHRTRTPQSPYLHAFRAMIAPDHPLDSLKTRNRYRLRDDCRGLEFEAIAAKPGGHSHPLIAHLDPGGCKVIQMGAKGSHCCK